MITDTKVAGNVAAVVNNLQAYEEAKNTRDVHELAMVRYRQAEEFEGNIREQALADLRFAEGDQWLVEDIIKRRSKNRPWLTFNRTAAFLDQLIGDYQRMNLDVKVSPLHYRGINFKDDKDIEWSMSQVYDGYVKEMGLRASTRRARNMAYDYQVTSGFGYHRIYADYTGDMSFDQDIYVLSVPNPFTVMMDPISVFRGPEYAQWAFVTDVIPRDEYKRKWKNRDSDWGPSNIRGTGMEGWYLEDGIRIAEYFVKYFVEIEMGQLDDGRVYTMQDLQKHSKRFEQEGVGISRVKTVNIPQVFWYLLDGSGVIEGPREFPSRYIPIVPSYGKMKIVDGEVTLRGAIRFAHDAQRLYNYSETTTAELISNAPKNQWVLDWDSVPVQLREDYKKANLDNLTALYYRSSKGSPPTRERPADIQPGFAQLTERAWENLKGTVGIFNDALGDVGPTVSAKAIRERTSESETVSFPFITNHTHAIEYETKVILDMMPRILDSQRVMKIVTPDDVDVYLTVNKVEWDPNEGRWTTANEISHTDVSIFVNIGPSAKTQRMEAVEMLSNALRDTGQAEPRLIPVLLKHIAINSDWTGARDFARIMDKAIPPELKDIGATDDMIPKEMLPMLIQQAVSQAMQEAGVTLENRKLEIEQFQAMSNRIRAMVDVFEARVKHMEAITNAAEAGSPRQLPNGPRVPTVAG